MWTIPLSQASTLHTLPFVTHLRAVSVTRLPVLVVQCLCSSNSYFTVQGQINLCFVAMLEGIEEKQYITGFSVQFQASIGGSKHVSFADSGDYSIALPIKPIISDLLNVAATWLRGNKIGDKWMIGATGIQKLSTKGKSNSLWFLTMKFIIWETCRAF